MKNLQHVIYKNKINYSKKKLSKRTNKYLCTLKVNKFRTQPVKLQVNALHFWQTLNNTNFTPIYFDFNKYVQIRLYISNSKANKESTITFHMSKSHTLDVTYIQPWFTVINDSLILADLQNNSVAVVNTRKFSDICILSKSTKLNSTKLKITKKLFKSNLKNPVFKVKNHKLFPEHITKFSKKWFKFECKKFKRFKSKYDGRDLKKKAPLQALYRLTPYSFKKKVVKKYQTKLSLIKEILIAGESRNTRIKELFKNLQTISVSSKKKVRKYSKFKFLRKKTIKTQCKLIKVMHINAYEKSQFKETSRKVNVPSKLLTKYARKWKVSKIKLFQRLSFNNSKKTKRKSSNYFLKNKKLKNTLKKINNQVKYKLKWFNYYEFKSFRWKFQKKRWYYTMSKWKRLAEFRRMLRNAWRNYRKLQKNFLFIKLLRANFKYILGIQESELLKKWVKVRRGTNSNHTLSSVDYLNQSLQLKLDGLSMFLGLAPNRLMAQELVRFGGLRVNGLIVTNKNYSLHQNDMLQIDSKVIQDINTLYKDAHWNSVRSRLKFTSFLQVQWSIMLFMLTRWPQSYELWEESVLNQRWVRFFIRYFPVRISKYKKAKVKWYKY